MLPASRGISIGASEGSGQSYCMGSISTSGSYQLASGAIKSAHVIKTDHYMQVTGQIDEQLLGIDGSDGGGQYDDAPHGSEPSSGADASLQGFPHYVEIVGGGIYCMRTCDTSGQDESSPCNMHRDTEGCANVIGGSYGSGFSYEDKSHGGGGGHRSSHKREDDDDYDDDDDDEDEDELGRGQDDSAKYEFVVGDLDRHKIVVGGHYFRYDEQYAL
ncbi:hypothetical protein HK101_008746 [Irineochytrium annulatum]|nr:hypothetical protein HK101_008746 [Irineochytrium annulatum]